MNRLVANMPIARCTEEECFSVSMRELFEMARSGHQAAKIEIARRRYNQMMKRYYAAYSAAKARGEEPPPAPPEFRGIEDWKDEWLAAPAEATPPPPAPPPQEPVAPSVPAPYPLAVRKVMDSSIGPFYAVYYAPGKFYPETCDNDRSAVQAHLARIKMKTNGRRRSGFIQ